MRTCSRLCAAVLTFVLFAAVPCGAAAIPAWLDDAITRWNEKNPSVRIVFVDIKDSFVWYRVQDTPEIGQAEIRKATDRITQERGYVVADDEEVVTTARPPSPGAPISDKKCWRRSFVLNLQNMSDTTSVGGEHAGQRQRMLTRLVCEDGEYWDAGFRIIE